MDRDRQLRDHLVQLLRGGNAHMPFAEAVAEFPEMHINTKPPRVAYSFWHLLEHLRITQADILDYLTNADYHAPSWPQDYWPDFDTRAMKQDWEESVTAFQRDLEAIVSIVTDDGTDLFASVPSNDEHTVLREVLSLPHRRTRDPAPSHQWLEPSAQSLARGPPSTPLPPLVSRTFPRVEKRS